MALLTQFLFSIYSVPGIVLDTGTQTVNKTDPAPPLKDSQSTEKQTQDKQKYMKDHSNSDSHWEEK